MTKYDNVVILGAGLSGLGCGLNLPGARIYEAKHHPGGHAYSHTLKNHHFDEGAHICHTQNSEFLNLITKQAGDICEINQSIVSNRWGDKWLTYPVQNHLRQLPLETRIPALTDLVIAQIDSQDSQSLNYRDWCLRQYGQTLTETFYEVFTKKYWRSDMEEMSTDWLGGRLLKSVLPSIIHGAFDERAEDQTKFSKFYYPKKGGFFSFFKPLYLDLDISYREKVVEIDLINKNLYFESGTTTSYDILASSVPLPVLVNSIKDVPSNIMYLSAKLKWTQSVIINFILNSPILRNEHWFYIYNEEIEASRVSIPSNITSTSNNTNCFQAEIFRHNEETYDIEYLQENTNRSMQNIFGYCDNDVSSTSTITAPFSYVISDKERESAVSQILEWLEANKIYSMGLYGNWKYMWSDIAYYSGQNTAYKIHKEFQK